MRGGGKGLRVLIRADASATLGAGHVMRCLTLARGLIGRGDEVHFASRPLAPALARLVEAAGCSLHLLPPPGAETRGEPDAGWENDAAETGAVAEAIGAVDWLVVDHYGIDCRWQQRLRHHARRLLVIDDLANRAHDCDCLLDMNQGRRAADYRSWVDPGCRLLLGPDYALIRPEFRRLREEAAAGTRKFADVERVLVSMGGTDALDVTARVLDGIASAGLACAVDVVLTSAAPHLEAVRRQCHGFAGRCHLHVDVADMAALMAAADLAVGAGGSSSWERCCLGLPTLLVVTADNQRPGAEALCGAGAAVCLGNAEVVDAAVLAAALRDWTADVAGLRRMSERAAGICDGLGVERVLRVMGAIAAGLGDEA